MHWLTTPTTILAIVYVASMGWGVKGHFDDAGGLPAGMKAITVGIALAFAWFLDGRWQVLTGQADVEPWFEVSASVLILGAMAVFWWAVATTRGRHLKVAFARATPSFLVTSGPYSWVRHPFYASYVLFWVGAAEASPWPAFWVVPLATAAVYGWLALKEEASFARSPLALDYVRYRSHTGMLVPVIQHLPTRVAK